MQAVTGIANAAGGAERRQAITGFIATEGLEFRLEEFVDRRMRNGTNIVVTIPGKSEASIVIGAHYDRVAVGTGALDNGASCAVLLELLRLFKAKPLTTHTLRVVFFDLEEGGLGGSQAHFAANAAQRPDYGINLDIFGYGNAFYATASVEEGPLAAALRQAVSEGDVPLRLFPVAQYPGTDHESMIRHGIETLSISLLDADEIDSVVAVITGQSKTIPPVLATIHTPKDSLEVIRPADVAKALPIVERLIRLVDEK
jgi:Zn-dependent M28 family amino/carboxypeptidase